MQAFDRDFAQKSISLEAKNTVVKDNSEYKNSEKLGVNNFRTSFFPTFLFDPPFPVKIWHNGRWTREMRGGILDFPLAILEWTWFLQRKKAWKPHTFEFIPMVTHFWWFVGVVLVVLVVLRYENSLTRKAFSNHLLLPWNSLKNAHP